MAAGRGEFFRSFLEGLERKPAQPTPIIHRQYGGREKPGPDGLFTDPNRKQSVHVRKKRRPKAEHNPISGTERSFNLRLAAPPPELNKISSSQPEENLLVRLPSEILIKILSYLDAPSLLCVTHVSKLLHRLANDDFIWQKVYMSEFGSQMWKLKLADDAVDAEDHSAGRWKKMYFRVKAGQEMKMWKKDLKSVNPYTGLPRQTEWVLRNMNVSWELTLFDHFGWECTLEQSRAHFFESSVIVCWSRASFLQYNRISSIHLYGVRKETPKSPKVRKPPWRSLIFKVDLKMLPHRFVGKDRLIKVFFLPGTIIGVWTAHDKVAFIMVSLHFHKLVERSLLGSPACPYSELLDTPPADVLDPEFGLHGYALHFLLHNSSTLIMSGHFHQLSCHRFAIQRGLVELRVISRTNLSQHRSLSGSIKLPWKSDGLEGAVENCCIMTLTLLDVFQKPFWCVSSPIYITRQSSSESSDYSGDQFLMDHLDTEGRVKMDLVWLEEQKQFFLIGLTVYVALFKVNQHFSRHY